MQFSVPLHDPCLAGHFPGRPLVPGVVVLERVVEAIEAVHGPLGPLRLPQVKFLRPLLPDRSARNAIEGAAPRWRFEVHGDGGVLARGEVVADG